MLIGTGITALGLVYYFLDPAMGYLPECPFYHFTHLYCPGCGSQRGLHALLHGNISAALAYNPLMVLSLIYISVEAGIWIVRQRLKTVRALSSYTHSPVIILVVVIVFWFLRNIPFAPFTFLAP